MEKFNLDWAYAYGRPGVIGQFRHTPEDFVVTEQLGFIPTGTGEHVYLHLSKRGDNTAWLARQIARLAGVNNFDVGYCGLKDRHAVTSQWFSVYFAKGTEPDWQQLQSDSVQLLDVRRHTHKLRRGQHQANHFCIQLHQLTGDLSLLSERLALVAAEGVPNYFGEQRFGIAGGNLHLAQRLLVDKVPIKNRDKRGLALSAARSYLFNQVLSKRVGLAQWQQPMDGDIDGVPTGPLWGRGRPLSQGRCLELESEVLGIQNDWLQALEHIGLSQERRALVLRPEQMQSQLEGESLTLEFSLPPGTFATSVLRELSMLETASREQS